MFRKTVQKNLRKIREDSKLSQVKLAKKSGLNLRFLSRLENSKEGENMTLDTLERLAKGLNCSAVDLLREPEKKSNENLRKLDKTIELLKEVRRKI